MTTSFDKAVSHAMLYEVGKFWNESHPAVANGLIDTPANRKAVGYVNDKADRGGETKFGVAKNANPDLDIPKLTWDAAKRVYYRRYWLQAHCDELAEISPKLALMHFDAAVNHGVTRAIKMLQTAVGVTVDGDIGPKTIAAVKLKCDSDGGAAMCTNLASQRRTFYNSIVQRDSTQSKFLRGWLDRINEVEQFAKTVG